MNLFKKVVATIALTTLVASTTVSSVSAYSTASADAAKKLAEQGVIVPHNNIADYRLDNNVLRQEVAAMAFAIAKLQKKSVCENEYTDVSATRPNTWACYVVEPLRDNGYLAKNKYFRPEDNITKAEALGMVVSAAFGDRYRYDATKGTSWQEQLVDFAVNNGILKAPFTDYNTPATRGVIFEWTVNAIDVAVQEEDDDLGLDELLNDVVENGDTETTEDNTNTQEEETTTEETATTSDLVVALNPETPAGADLPKGADGVLVMKLDLTAGNEDTSVTELNFERTGFGEDAADKVSLFANGTRLTKSKVFNSDDEANVSISPALVIKAGETVTVDVRVDTSEDTYGEFAVKLTGVTASTDVEANEIVSNTFDVKNVEATRLLFQTGSVNSQVTAGELNADVAEFELKNDGNVNNSDITVTSITLKEVGTIDQDTELANLKLVNDGKVLAEVPAMADKYVTFNLDTPVLIKDGKTETFTVTADITGGADKTIKFVLDTDGDIIATATKYTAVNVVNEFVGQEVTVQAGELTLYSIDAEKDKVRDDTDDVELGKLKIVNVAGKDLNIKNFGIEIKTQSGTTAQDVNPSKVLENVKVEINGTSYDLYSTDTTATGYVLYKDTDLDIALPQGTTIATILADTLDDLADGTTIEIKLNVDGADNKFSADDELYVEEDDDDTQVTDITPSELSWDDLEIKQPKATVSKTPLANVSVVKGTSDITALQFEVEANEVSDLTIDKVNVLVSYSGGYGNSVKDYVSEVKLYKGTVSEANKLDSVSGTKLGTVSNDATNHVGTGSANFDGFEVTIPADQTETFIVVVSTVDSDAVVGAKIAVQSATTNFLNVEDDQNDDAIVENNIKPPYKEITLKDTGKLSINVATSADNVDNENDKTILAGTEQVIFSVDVKATNEEIDLERIKFEITTNSGAELRDDIKEAKLYLGDELVATTSNSKVTLDNGKVYVSFEDMNNTIIPTTSDELKLGIVTETIGYEKVGTPVTSAKVSAVLLDENYVKGVESNDKVDVDEDGSIDVASFNTTSVAKNVAIVPMVVTPSVTDKFGTDDLNATIKIAADAGDNTTKEDGDSLVAILTGVTLDVSSITSTGTLTLFNGNGDEIATAIISSTTQDTVTFTFKNGVTEYVVDGGEYYRIETTAEASFRLSKNGVEYVADGNKYTTNLDNTQDMGTYSDKSN